MDQPTAQARCVSIGLHAIRHPATVAKLVATGALAGVGSSTALPRLNVFYHEHRHAEEIGIGLTFAGVSAFVALGSLLTPFVASRLGKVNGVVFTRLLSVPFIFDLALSPDSAADASLSLSVVGVIVAMRALLGTVSLPLYDAFSMEVLNAGERATTVGLEAAAASLLQAGTSILGSTWMAGGDYESPFLVAATCLASTALF